MLCGSVSENAAAFTSAGGFRKGEDAEGQKQPQPHTISAHKVQQQKQGGYRLSSFSCLKFSNPFKCL